MDPYDPNYFANFSGEENQNSLPQQFSQTPRLVSPFPSQYNQSPQSFNLPYFMNPGFPSQNFRLPPPNFQFQAQGSQYPQNFPINPYNLPPYNPSPVHISDRGSDNQTHSSGSLGENRFGNINLNVPISSPTPPIVIEEDIPDDVPTRRGKEPARANMLWTRREQEAFVSAWLNTTHDPIKGASQKSDSYWRKVANKFNEATGCNAKPETLKTYWNKKRPKITTFDGCYKRAREVLKSGWSDQNYIERAHELYFSEQKQSFKLENWWHLLKGHPKWNDLIMTEQPSKKVRLDESGTYSTSSGGNTIDEAINTLRPIGRDAAKRKGKGKVGVVSEIPPFAYELEERRTAAMEKMASAKQAHANAKQAQANAKQAQADASKAKAEAYKTKAILEFMSKDTSTMTQEEKEQHKAMCAMLRDQMFGS